MLKGDGEVIIHIIAILLIGCIFYFVGYDMAVHNLTTTCGG